MEIIRINRDLTKLSLIGCSLTDSEVDSLVKALDESKCSLQVCIFGSELFYSIVLHLSRQSALSAVPVGTGLSIASQI